MASSSSIVLVPGAWHTPACFDQFRSVLAELDLSTIAVANPSVGDNTVSKTLTDDVENLRSVLIQLIEQEGKPITVVAHSYGGMVASGAVKDLGYAQRKRAGKRGGVTMVVYLAACALPEGMTVVQSCGGSPAPWWECKDGQIFANDRTISNPAHALYNDLPPAMQEHAISQLQPVNAASFEMPNSYEPWRDIPCTYIFAEQDNCVPLPGQQYFVSLMGDAVATASLDTSHSPFLSKPRELAALVQRAVRDGLKRCGGS
ncbi:Alpha/beta hydrolase fold-1 [Talaromyces proteolyticus]|uniref:Alpha/beta hydrolase fold-1 n=1 Tax=Talaromyces proteolyticus TaxID=1131652 RepID=A0AAD4KX91_9EURO|nr:Alpha/beta hydrolase fold-1 [Talaromyces proteolyticus]KAH8701986.1 Alpha/beta hydrolase fold-1 [Talaromyces proteolyticus]